jgi:tetratricopeptide (TPR) repeat protein
MLNKAYHLSILLLLTFLTACQSLQTSAPEPVTEAQPKVEEVKKVDPAVEMYDLAISTAKAGQTDESIDFFRQLIALDPEFKHAHTNLGLLLFHKSMIDQAKSEFITAIAQDNQDAIAYNHLAIIERQQGLFEQAKQHYQDALKIDSNYANAHLNLGILLDIYLQQWKDALAEYQKYQQLTGNKNETVEKWIADIQRRIEKQEKTGG